ncbi:hypothetical protein D9613_004840 [Agrocybe pediades]|uniref:Tyrosinase copper-binding domain-containing protein n=1 Tax=Agrocybe pediades TaxID=84607 RepID=A0A8H4QXJ4_9AGAR|nr:hypothetical protein D9613_004840 [Agrocybe pediades]
MLPPGSSVVLVLLCFVHAASVYCETIPWQDRRCRNLLVRREWRTLEDYEKHHYLKAVQCLQSLPAHNPAIKAARTRFDEFQAHHITIADEVHNVGQFLPFHRQFVKSYELALRNECGYRGAQPYWDWTLDTHTPEAYLHSPIWDAITGFGGNGLAGTYQLPPGALDPHLPANINPYLGCVQDGPFTNHTLSLGPRHLITDHCLTRGFDASSAVKYITTAARQNAFIQPTFELFRIELEGGSQTRDRRMHDGGHISVGGEMSDFYSSPGDPIFYLHHANLDHIWWKWQNVDRENRLYQISGRSTTSAPFVNVTLDYTLQMGSVGKSVQIRDVMDIHTEENCYTYA